MRKIKIVTVLTTISIIGMSTLYSAVPAKAVEGNIKSYTIENVSNREDIDIVRNNEGIVKNINGKYTNIAIKNGEDAIRSLDSVKDLFGFKEPSKEFVVSKIDTNTNGTVYRLQRVYNEYTVYNNEVIIVVDNEGTATSINANYSNMDNVKLKFSVSKMKSIILARKHCEKLVTEYETEKIIYTDSEGNAQAAWKVKCINKRSATKNKIIFINAESGEVISEQPLTINL